MSVHGLTDQTKRPALHAALELDGATLHPNNAELLDRHILRMDCASIGALVMLIEAAKARAVTRSLAQAADSITRQPN